MRSPSPSSPSSVGIGLGAIRAEISGIPAETRPELAEFPDGSAIVSIRANGYVIAVSIMPDAQLPGLPHSVRATRGDLN